VNGYASRHLHETWREGDRVRLSAPAGSFVFRGHEAGRVVLIAGGIGVTPMISIVRSLTDRAWSGDIFLILAIKTAADFTFRDELAYLQSRFPNLRVAVCASDEPDGSPWHGARGRVTRDLIDTVVGPLTSGPVFLCGPTPMMAAMRSLLVGMGVPDAEILQEAFVSRPPVDEPDASGSRMAELSPRPLADDAIANVAFARSRRTASARGDETLLEIAEEAGVDIRFECRSGICGQCRTRLVGGRVIMDVDDALTAADRAQGVVLACQARAASDLVVDA
jgi:ferredoxin-NADP reductase